MALYLLKSNSASEDDDEDEEYVEILGYFPYFGVLKLCVYARTNINLEECDLIIEEFDSSSTYWNKITNINNDSDSQFHLTGDAVPVYYAETPIQFEKPYSTTMFHLVIENKITGETYDTYDVTHSDLIDGRRIPFSEFEHLGLAQ